MAQMLRGSKWADVEVDEECEIHGCVLAEILEWEAAAEPGSTVYHKKNRYWSSLGY